ITDRGQNEQLLGDEPPGAVGDARWANDVDIERQMRTMLFPRSERHDADLSHFDGVVNFGPGQLLVAKFSGSAAHGIGDWEYWELVIGAWPLAIENDHHPGSGRMLALRPFGPTM